MSVSAAILTVCNLSKSDMDTNNLLSKDQCCEVLERYIGSKNFSIQFYSINPLASQLDGMISEQYILKIQYQIESKDNLAQFFLKTLSESNPVLYEISRSIYVYEKESFYYETVVPLLESRGLDVDYVPKSYFSEPFVIVLEDLTLRSFKGTPKNKPVDLKHCKKCLEVLAKFHAQPILYELEKSKELGRKYRLTDEFSDILEDKVFCKEENGATKFMQCSIKGLFQLIDLVPENGVDKSDFKVALQDLLDKLMSTQGDSIGFRSTLQHGDLWSNNFLFGYENSNSEITECVLLDYQTLKYGPPAYDVLQFIFTNTRRTFRQKHQQELLDHYYQFFSGLLVDRGFLTSEILSEDEFQSSCKVLALPAKIQSVTDRAITFLSDEVHLEAAKSPEAFTKYLYEDRGKYMVNGFNQNEEYKELMIEEITELREMLFAV